MKASPPAQDPRRSLAAVWAVHGGLLLLAGLVGVLLAVTGPGIFKSYATLLPPAWYALIQRCVELLALIAPWALALGLLCLASGLVMRWWLRPGMLAIAVCTALHLLGLPPVSWWLHVFLQPDASIWWWVVAVEILTALSGMAGAIASAIAVWRLWPRDRSDAVPG